MAKTIVDFYSSSNGPTVRIDVQEISAIKTLLHAFERLSSRLGERVDLTSLPEFVFTERIGRLVLTSVELSTRKKKVVQTSPKETVASFEMRGSGDDWTDARRLLAPLVTGSPSHQYFSSVPPDDAIIEIAIKEPRPRWTQESPD